MCRLFGFRSIIKSQVHSSLVHAENSLGPMSLKHPDGWGVAYYLEDIPHILKSTERAFDDQIFHRVSGIVSSHTVLAHIRKATNGNLNILNSHPFQYGHWVFAHNGNLKGFNSYNQVLKKEVDPQLERFILGTTDSEIIFFILLTLIKKRQPLSKSSIKTDTLAECIEELCGIITKHSGPLYPGDDNDPTENHLTFILSSGKNIFGFNGGQSINYSTHKSLCPERETCNFFNQTCEKKSSGNSQVNHLIFSSEELKGENIWFPVRKGELVSTNEDMLLSIKKLNIKFG